MADPHLLAGLRAKRNEIASEIGRLRADLRHIDAAIRIVADPEPDRLAGPQKRILDVGRLIFDALRAAPGELSTAQLARVIADKLELDTTDKDVMQTAVATVGRTAARYRKRGHLIGERRGAMTWWRLPL